MRALALAVIVGLALMALYVWGRPSPVGDTPTALTFVATANQLGVVGYRDPGGRVLRRRPVRRLQRGPVRARRASGRGNERIAAAVGWPGAVADVAGRPPRARRGHGSATRWWVYDAQAATRDRLWSTAARGIRSGLGRGATAERSPAARRQRRMAHGWRRRAAGKDGPQLWRIRHRWHAGRTVRPRATRPSSPAWMPLRRSPAWSSRERPRRASPRRATPSPWCPCRTLTPSGPIAVSPDGRHVYFASPERSPASSICGGSIARRPGARRGSPASRATATAPSMARDGTRAVSRADLSHARRRVARRPDAPAHDLPGRDAVVAPDAAAALAHLTAPGGASSTMRSIPTSRRRSASSTPIEGLADEPLAGHRPVRLRGSGDGVVAERQLDRVALASRAVRRCVAAAGGWQRARSAHHVARPRRGSGLAALVARWARPCCSTAPSATAIGGLRDRRRSGHAARSPRRSGRCATPASTAT